jgi:ApaG protein
LFRTINARILPAPVAPRRRRPRIAVAAHAELVCNAGPRIAVAFKFFMTNDKKYSVAVTARSTYLAEQSNPDNDRHVFAYTIRIVNTGSVAAQLLSRHWIIADANNQVQEVRGLGVIGEQPTLQPGETYEYSSASMIATPVGTMRGSYQMQALDGTQFETTIPEFTLSMPRVLH